MVSRKTPLKALKSAVLPAAVLALSLALMAGNTNPGYAATDVSKWKPGQTFKDCPECPELVVIPAGIFIMGLNGKSKKSKPSCQPARKKQKKQNEHKIDLFGLCKYFPLHALIPQNAYF